MLAVVQDGLHGIRNYVPEGVPLLGVGNVTEDGVTLQEVKRITFDEHRRLAASQVRRGDLLVTITGRLGTAALYETNDPANLSAHVALCRPKPGHELLYLKHYLGSRFGKASFLRAQIGSTHPHINVRRLIDLPIPLPPQRIQQQLAAFMEDASTARQLKLRDADTLLSGLDNFVLDILGIILMPSSTHRTTYAVRLRDVVVGRKLYPDYFHPERMNAIKSVQAKYPGNHSATLLSIADFRRDQRQVEPNDNYLGLANVQPNTGEYVESADDAGEGTVFSFDEGDVLFARLRPYLNKVYRADRSGVCSPEFHVLRIHKEPDGRPSVRPDYLAAVLRSSIVLAQTRHMMTGNTHPRLANEDVINLVVPVPSDKVQETVASEVERRRTEARRLRIQAAQIWSDAKRRFEEALLRPVSNADQSKTVGFEKRSDD